MGPTNLDTIAYYEATVSLEFFTGEPIKAVPARVFYLEKSACLTGSDSICTANIIK